MGHRRGTSPDNLRSQHKKPLRHDAFNARVVDHYLMKPVDMGKLEDLVSRHA